MEKLKYYNIKSRTPISPEILREKFTVIYEFEDTYRHWYLINKEPNIWAVERETAFGVVWEVHRNLITLIVNHVEEVEWIVATLQWSWQKRHRIPTTTAQAAQAIRTPKRIFDEIPPFTI